ncbi:unnamed protein product, partial [Rhizoctonia solani]
TLSIDEKKADRAIVYACNDSLFIAYFVAFGPHGPRTPVTPEGQTMKVIGGTIFILALASGAFGIIRSYGQCTTPHTISKEYQQSMNERALEQKMNPLTGEKSDAYRNSRAHIGKPTRYRLRGLQGPDRPGNLILSTHVY